VCMRPEDSGKIKSWILRGRLQIYAGAGGRLPDDDEAIVGWKRSSGRVVGVVEYAYRGVVSRG
jgi:hypothetical protein